ncbi:sigma-70 family RNA polymerase sigma factor [Halalkalibacter hemicellulosilyticus]|uniref:Putative RNA polymerase sigma factor n=1 Tax=Halalkalibacter hemicellulosilyticusJCM 9152 TaxID=1236971 RepID=W4QHV3_9BACI|nr:sigma-70 family RNA polymerase sigma factor [Halalkalibacter hemicellulosilyticus]GAE31705.1 putative RNA polymerase sigma factor [Halalkalibacter hemicellulosilyticusJCM 9152]
MSEHEWIAEQFEVHRNHMKEVAYRMLGSLNDAEDAVQETWLRLSRSNMNSIDNLRGWLTTVVSRVCLDMLRSRKSRKEESIETQLPDMITNHQARIDPEFETVLAESVGLALLVVLDSLNPSERIAFVLHDIFGIPFNDIASIVGKSETATRKLASRARRRVKGVKETTVEQDRQGELINAFLTAAYSGDFETLIAALDPDVVLYDDRKGATKVTRGAKALAKQVLGRAQSAQIAIVNGSVGVIVAPRGRLLYVLTFIISNGKITKIDLVSSPARIEQLDLKVFRS